MMLHISIASTLNISLIQMNNLHLWMMMTKHDSIYISFQTRQ